MAMDGLFGLVCALVTAAPSAPTIPPARGDAVETNLAVQTALARGRQLLNQGNSKGAVDVLEAQLPRINGNRAYLLLLRDAYREHLKALSFQDRPEQVKKYQERLAILDPAAPPVTAPPKALRDRASTIRVPLPSPAPANKGLVARGKNPEDPFAFEHQNKDVPPADHARPADVGEARGTGTQEGEAKAAARRLLAQAEEEYGKKAFGRARLLFAQAHQADETATAQCRERWGYCKLHFVVEVLNRKNTDPSVLPELEREIRAALDMAPRLDATGKWLLQEIGERKSGGSRATEVAGEVSVRHLGRNAQGWSVAKSANFTILHRQDNELAERVARVAEQSRAAMARKWFGQVLETWEPSCQIVLHADGREYSQATGQSAASPGHSRIESDTGRVVSRRIHLRCDHPGMLTGVLPHETTHVVLAGNFGKYAVPRWADEGMAVLSEPEEKVTGHRKNLARCRQTGQLFAVRELMQMDDYPQARRVGAFYAQSVSLVDFLVKERGSVAFAQFLRDALRDGYETALEKHYNYRGFEELEARWKKNTFAGAEDYTAGFRTRKE
jgi:hypothetical protein